MKDDAIMTEVMLTGARISDCGLYRYTLERIWDVSKARLVFCMLNPSTADANKDDPTIRKCMGFARQFGYGGIVVVNLYAFRATDPKELKDWYEHGAGNIVGPDNHAVIHAVLKVRKDEPHKTFVAAWGATKSNRPRFISVHIQRVLNIAREHGRTPMCLGLTKDRDPRHPLYMPYGKPLQELPSW